MPDPAPTTATIRRSISLSGGSWGTHYDVLPPDPTPELQSAGPLARWFYIGLLPQMTIWIPNTVLVGTLFGALVVAVAKPARRA